MRIIRLQLKLFLISNEVCLEKSFIFVFRLIIGGGDKPPFERAQAMWGERTVDEPVCCSGGTASTNLHG
ncbi:MAG: hypothetical protein ACP5GU_04255 [Thermoprotei archaeon]